MLIGRQLYAFNFIIFDCFILWDVCLSLFCCGFLDFINFCEDHFKILRFTFRTIQIHLKIHKTMLLVHSFLCFDFNFMTSAYYHVYFLFTDNISINFPACLFCCRLIFLFCCFRIIIWIPSNIFIFFRIIFLLIIKSNHRLKELSRKQH